MLLKSVILKKIKSGEINTVFRTWKKPRVLQGTNFHTAIGQMQIDSIEELSKDSLKDKDLIGSDLKNLNSLLKSVGSREGKLYKIRLSYVGEDPRKALAQKQLDEEEFENVLTKLSKMDRLSHSGNWTRSTLEIIKANPAKRAPDLAKELGLEKDPFKRNVRKLKGLGLTQSLKVGYRLSPRGHSYLEKLEKLK